MKASEKKSDQFLTVHVIQENYYCIHVYLKTIYIQHVFKYCEKKTFNDFFFVKNVSRKLQQNRMNDTKGKGMVICVENNDSRFRLINK